MFVDDRLETVLRQPASGGAGLRTQFRQMLDLLGAERSGEAKQLRTNPTLAKEVWRRMDALAEALPTNVRAAIVRDAGWRLRSRELTAYLAQCEPEVASAAIERAQLSVADWSELIVGLPIQAHAFLAQRRDLPLPIVRLLDQLGIHDRGLPHPDQDFRADQALAEQEPHPDDSGNAKIGSRSTDIPADIGPLERESRFADLPPSLDPTVAGRNEISALVDRIARFQRERASATATPDPSQSAPGPDSDIDPAGPEDMPRLPLGGDMAQDPAPVSAFGFATDTLGRIEWAEGEAGPMVIGTRVTEAARPEQADNDDDTIRRAIDRRQRIEQAVIVLEGAPAIAGEWIMDASPHFTSAGGFCGHVGRMRRSSKAADTAERRALREADRIRQLLHELRTPVTAVQGYAEVIQQQLFGTAPHAYRALAAAIAADAARILAGFDELDHLAKLELGVAGMEAGQCDLFAIARTMVQQLALVLAERRATITIARNVGADGERADASNEPGFPQWGRVTLEQGQAEALTWRLLATLASACAEGETLTASFDQHGECAQLSCNVPKALSAQRDIYAAHVPTTNDAIIAGPFGSGFALRLARAEARAAGGDLEHKAHGDGETITLSLPLAGSDGSDGTQGDRSRNHDSDGEAARTG